MGGEPCAELERRLRQAGVVLDPDRLDQHLLCDPRVLETLVAGAGLAPEDVVLDAGAGPGTIAEAVAPAAGRVLAVEVDGHFAPLLERVRAEHANVDVVLGDVFAVDLSEVDVVVANLPFTLTEALMARLYRTRVRALSVIASRSFAASAAAEPGDAAFGRTSVYTRASFGVDAAEPVPAAAFLPPPAHPSALVRLSRRPSSRSRRALADALSRRAHERVRDLAARLRVDRSALGVRPQARLQALTNDEIATLAAALDERASRSGAPALASAGAVTPERDRWDELYGRAVADVDRPPGEVDSVPIPDVWGELPDDEEQALSFLLTRVAGARRLLDLGCGTGSVLAALLRRVPGGEGVGVDGSAVAIETGRAHLERAGDLVGRTTLVCGDLRAVSASELGTFDVVYALFSLQFVGAEDFRSLVRAVRGLLGRSGTFAGTVRSTSRSVPASYTPVPGSPNTYVSHEPHEAGMTYHHYSLEELREAAELLGGRLVHLEERFANRSYDPAPRRAWWDFAIEC